MRDAAYYKARIQALEEKASLVPLTEHHAELLEYYKWELNSITARSGNHSADEVSE